MKDNLVVDLCVEELVKCVGMSLCNFVCIYVDEIGQILVCVVEMMWIEVVCIVLEDFKLMVKQVFVQCGFGSDECMCCSFICQLGVLLQVYWNLFVLSEQMFLFQIFYQVGFLFVLVVIFDGLVFVDGFFVVGEVDEDFGYVVIIEKEMQCNDGVVFFGYSFLQFGNFVMF